MPLKLTGPVNAYVAVLISIFILIFLKRPPKTKVSSLGIRFKRIISGIQHLLGAVLIKFSLFTRKIGQFFECESSQVVKWLMEKPISQI